MNILTDEEIIFIENITASRSYNNHARAIEAAVLSKLAEQAGEPVAWEWVNPEKGMRISHQEPPEYEEVYQISKLYTEAQLIAAQQRTAEACAKLLNDNLGHLTRGDALVAIRNGEWREYL